MKKFILLFSALVLALSFTGCKKDDTSSNVAYSIGSLAGSWTGIEKDCRFIQDFLVKNNYQMEGITYYYNKDAEMIKFFDGKYEDLKKENEKGNLTKILHDQEIRGGTITFKYVLLSSNSSHPLAEETITVTY